MAQRITEAEKNLPVSRNEFWKLMPEVTRKTIYRRYNRILRLVQKGQNRHVELSVAEVSLHTGLSVSHILKTLEK
ncbi:MAG: hypothetical protein AAFP89_26700 [Bacteroidota bacterium]